MKPLGQGQRLEPGANRVLGMPQASASELKKLFDTGDPSPINGTDVEDGEDAERKRKFEFYKKKHLENSFHFYIPRS